jgi:hypothetical protein
MAAEEGNPLDWHLTRQISKLPLSLFPEHNQHYLIFEHSVKVLTDWPAELGNLTVIVSPLLNPKSNLGVLSSCAEISWSLFTDLK